MEKKTIVDLIKELDHKDLTSFMKETAEFVNEYCSQQGKQPIFFIDYDLETITNVSNFITSKDFGDYEGIKDRDYDCDDIYDAFNLIDFIYSYDLFRCEDNNKILKKMSSTDECPVYFIDQGRELYISNFPESFLSKCYTTSKGCMPEFVQYFNALFTVDRFKGTLSLNEIFDSVKECEDKIINWCEECGYISYGTTDSEAMKEYYLNLIEDNTSENMDEDDIDAVNNWKEQLNKLDSYLKENKLSNKTAGIKL